VAKISILLSSHLCSLKLIWQRCSLRFGDMCAMCIVLHTRDLTPLMIQVSFEALIVSVFKMEMQHNVLKLGVELRTGSHFTLPCPVIYLCHLINLQN
jgi:hypothetical protein